MVSSVSVSDLQSATFWPYQWFCLNLLCLRIPERIQCKIAVQGSPRLCAAVPSQLERVTRLAGVSNRHTLRSALPSVAPERIWKWGARLAQSAGNFFVVPLHFFSFTITLKQWSECPTQLNSTQLALISQPVELSWVELGALITPLIILVSVFVMASTVWSVPYLLFMVPRCLGICKSGGTCPPCPIAYAPCCCTVFKTVSHWQLRHSGCCRQDLQCTMSSQHKICWVFLSSSQNFPFLAIRLWLDLKVSRFPLYYDTDWLIECVAAHRCL